MNKLLQYLFPSSDTSRGTIVQFSLDVLFFALFFITPILISIRLKQVFNCPKYLFVGALAALMALVWIVSSLVKREFILPRQLTVGLFALVIAWEFITISRSGAVDLSLREYGVQFSLFVIFVVAAANIKDKERIENLLHFAIASGVIAAGFGLLQYYRLDEIVFRHMKIPGLFDLSYLILPQKPEEYVKIYSFMGHRNYLAGYLICLLPIVLSRLLSSLSIAVRGGRYRNLGLRQSLVYGASFALMFTVVMLTHTRGSWVGLTAGVLCFACIGAYKFRQLQLGRGTLAILLLTVTLVLIFGAKEINPGIVASLALFGICTSVSLVVLSGKRFLSAIVLNVLLSLALGFYVGNGAQTENKLVRMRDSALQRFTTAFDLRRGSAFQRILIWRTAWRIISDNPLNFLFGTGFGSFGLNYMPFQAKVLAQAENKRYMPMVNKSIYAHSEYLHFWSEIGLVGILLMFATAGSFVWAMAGYISRCEVNYQNLLLVGMFCSTIAVLVHNIFSFSLHLPYTASLFYCIVAFCLRYEGSPDIRWAWGARSRADGQFRVQDGWLGLSLLPLSEGRIRACASWLSTPSSRPDEAVTVSLRSKSGKTVIEKQLGFSRPDPLVFDRKGEARGWSLAALSPQGECGTISFSDGDTTGDDGNGYLFTFGWILLVSMAVYYALHTVLVFLLVDADWRDAFLKFKLKRYDEAIIDYRRALDLDDSRGEILFDYGRALMDSQRNFKAIEQFRKATRNFVDPANYHNIALCYYKEKKYKKAEENYRKALELNPIYEQSLANLAFYLVGQQRFDEARRLLAMGLKYYPKNASVKASMGMILASERKYDKAVKLLRKAVELNPQLISAKINLATILYNKGDFEGAKLLYEKLLRERPRDPMINRKYLGTRLALYQKALAKDPGNLDAMRGLGITYARLCPGKPEYAREAVRFIRGYLPNKVDDVEARYFLAVALQQMGYYREALSEARAALAGAPQDSELRSPLLDRIRVLEIKVDENPDENTPGARPGAVVGSVPGANIEADDSGNIGAEPAPPGAGSPR